MGFVKKPAFYVVVAFLGVAGFWLLQWAESLKNVLAPSFSTAGELPVFISLNLTAALVAFTLMNWVKFLNQNRLHPGWSLLWALNLNNVSFFIVSPQEVWAQCFLILGFLFAFARRHLMFAASMALALLLKPVVLSFYFLLAFGLLREAQFFRTHSLKQKFVKWVLFLLPMGFSWVGSHWVPSPVPASIPASVWTILPVALVALYWMLQHLRHLNLKDFRFLISVGIIVTTLVLGKNGFAQSPLPFVLIPLLKLPENTKKRLVFASLTLVSFILPFIEWFISRGSVD